MNFAMRRISSNVRGRSSSKSISLIETPNSRRRWMGSPYVSQGLRRRTSSASPLRYHVDAQLQLLVHLIPVAIYVLIVRAQAHHHPGRQVLQWRHGCCNIAVAGFTVRGDDDASFLTSGAQFRLCSLDLGHHFTNVPTKWRTIGGGSAQCGLDGGHPLALVRSTVAKLDRISVVQEAKLRWSTCIFCKVNMKVQRIGKLSPATAVQQPI